MPVARATTAGHISVMKTATPTANGTAISSASNDETSVPYTNGHAPNCSLTGSHSLAKKNFHAERVPREARFRDQLVNDQPDQRQHRQAACQHRTMEYPIG